jgi:hypothetical protein
MRKMRAPADGAENEVRYGKRGRVVECTGLDEIAWSDFEQRSGRLRWPQRGEGQGCSKYKPAE